jgi:UDP-glucuronate 4-epimerase
MKILVTGGAGFIGSHLTEQLIKNDKDVIVIDSMDPYYQREIKENNITNIKKIGNFKFFENDITNANDMEAIIKNESIDTIIHLAAKAGVRASIQDPISYVNTNVLGTTILLELSRKYNVKKFILGSSSSVYGNSQTPFVEDKTKPPLSPYGSTKMASEVICSTFNSLYGIETTALRFFTVYGPRGRPDMAIQKFLTAIEKSNEIVLFDNGNLRRDFTYVDDIVDAIIKSCGVEQKKFESINIGNNNPTEIRYIVKLLEMETGKKAIIKNESKPSTDPDVTHADISKAKKILKWEPMTNIETGIRETVKWWNTEGKTLYM